MPSPKRGMSVVSKVINLNSLHFHQMTSGDIKRLETADPMAREKLLKLAGLRKSPSLNTNLKLAISKNAATANHSSK